jgi:hypothetical protein
MAPSVLGKNTIRIHVAHLLGKLGLRDRVQAIVVAYETGLVPPELAPRTPIRQRRRRSRPGCGSNPPRPDGCKRSQKRSAHDPSAPSLILVHGGRARGAIRTLVRVEPTGVRVGDNSVPVTPAELVAQILDAADRTGDLDWSVVREDFEIHDHELPD